MTSTPSSEVPYIASCPLLTLTCQWRALEKKKKKRKTPAIDTDVLVGLSLLNFQGESFNVTNVPGLSMVHCVDGCVQQLTALWQ